MKGRNCRQIRDWLGAYADGELDQARTQSVAAHLRTCAACRQDMAEIQHLHQLAKQHFPESLGEDRAEHIRLQVGRQLRERTGPSELRRRRAGIPWFGLATAGAGLLVVLVALVSGVLSNVLSPSRAEKRAQEMTANAPARSPGTPAVAVAPAPVQKPAGSAGRRAAPAAAATPKVDGGAAVSAQPEARAETRVDDQLPGGQARSAAPAPEPAAPGQTAARPAARPALPLDEIAEFLSKLAQAEPPKREPASGRGDSDQDRAGTAGQMNAAGADTAAGLLSSPAVGSVFADSGTAYVNVLVGTDGMVRAVTLKQSSGSPALDTLALNLARGARFQPRVEDGVRQETWLTIPFQHVPKTER